METRKAELLQLQSHIAEFDTELTKILQHLQWDRKNLVEDCPKVVCRYNANHKVPQQSKEKHEAQCRLALNGYSKEDKMLPDPLDHNAKTLIQLDNYNIQQIINQAVNTDPLFKKAYIVVTFDASSRDNIEIEPQTLERLQSTYTGDERRAIYDAVVQAAPFCHDLSDLALFSEQGAEDTSKKQKSRVEILAELRDMKRRRTKYRVAAKTSNYSDVLRDVIKTQMEVYSHVKVEKTDKISSNEKHRDDKRLDRNDQIRSFKIDSVRASEYIGYNHKRDREKSRSIYDEHIPSTSKKTYNYDEIDSSSKHESHSDTKNYDSNRERDRYLSKDRSRNEDRYDVKVEDQRENRSRKRYHEDSETSRNDNKISSIDKYRSEQYSSGREHKKERHRHKSGRRSPSRDHREEKQYSHRSDRHSSSSSQREGKQHRLRNERQSSSREQMEGQYELKSYYASYEYKSVKDKKMYSEYRK